MTNDASDSNAYIDGIHNYCDRWCERCAFTSRCRAYAIEQAEFAHPESHDLTNEAFWDKLHGIFRSALGQLREKAEHMGIDLDDVTAEDMQIDSPEERQLDQHPCVVAAEAYRHHTHLWFESHQQILAEKSQELKQTAALNLPDNPIEEEFMEIKDLLEVTQWYYPLIAVKVRRALSGMDLIEVDDDLHDARGSAKVALIAMDRSIAAWTRLCDHLPDQEDSVIDLLLELDRLRKQLEEQVPDARAFIRPGFDE